MLSRVEHDFFKLYDVGVRSGSASSAQTYISQFFVFYKYIIRNKNVGHPKEQSKKIRIPDSVQNSVASFRVVSLVQCRKKIR